MGFPEDVSTEALGKATATAAAAQWEGRLTEPTSGPPLDPGGPRSAVVEAVDRRVAEAHGVAGSAGLSARRGVRADATITTTTTVSFHGNRHCYRNATVALCAESRCVRRY